MADKKVYCDKGGVSVIPNQYNNYTKLPANCPYMYIDSRCMCRSCVQQKISIRSR